MALVTFNNKTNLIGVVEAETEKAVHLAGRYGTVIVPRAFIHHVTHDKPPLSAADSNDIA